MRDLLRMRQRIIEFRVLGALGGAAREAKDEG